MQRVARVRQRQLSYLFVQLCSSRQDKGDARNFLERQLFKDTYWLIHLAIDCIVIIIILPYFTDIVYLRFICSFISLM